MHTQQIRIRTGACRLDADGIFHITFDPGAQETLADAQEAMRAHTLLRAGRPCAVFVDMRQLKSQDRDARQFYGSPDIASAAPAVALLVGSRVSQLIANFFVSVTKTSVPTRLFTDEAEALAWLRGFQV
jgi:hypothetical protein